MSLAVASVVCLSVCLSVRVCDHKQMQEVRFSSERTIQHLQVELEEQQR